MDGILNIHKATGMTSHDVVARVRKLLRQKRVGHAGTLDPAASGVLPICVGQATRVAEYVSESGKAYRAVIVFGVVTDTYDAEGAIVRSGEVGSLTFERIEEVLKEFVGPQMQKPPRFSAIKMGGQPAYRMARAGLEVEMALRPVVIASLQALAWQPPCLTVGIECSKGTYMRSLAYDVGERLGCGAHLGGLERTRSGPFAIEQSNSLEQLAEAVEEGRVESMLHPMDSALQEYMAIVLDEAGAERALHGNAFGASGEQRTQLARVYDERGRLLAIAERDEARAMWRPKKVLAEVELRVQG